MGEKNLVYYFSSDLYSEHEILEKMEKEKKEYKKKNPQLEIHLNEFGTYVAKLVFTNTSMKVEKRRKKSSNKQYGKYKKKKMYTPI